MRLLHIIFAFIIVTTTVEENGVWSFSLSHHPSSIRRRILDPQQQTLSRNYWYSTSPPTPNNQHATYYSLTVLQDRRGTSDYDDDTTKVTIQILMSDTGGGHRASANALRDAFDVLYPGKIHCDIVDIYTDYGPFWPYNDYINMYKFMAKHPWTWDLFYKFGATPFGMALNVFLLETFCFEPFTKCINRPQKTNDGKRADMIISVHPLTQDIPLKITSYLDSNGTSRTWKGRTKTPFVTVVTDLGGAHPTWFHSGVDKCFVPSDALHQAAKQRGLSESQIKQHGLPIRKGFWNEYNSKNSGGGILNQEQKKQLRKELGFKIDNPTVLVVGGGDGMGGLVDISKELGHQLGNTRSSTSNVDKPSNYQMVVVCGNNVEAKQALQQETWPANLNVIIQGFVNNMDEYMKASDVLVTKAGPGTIAEASICGLPCMMFAYLPGQEEGNIPFVENAGFGKFSSNPNDIAQIVSSWLSSPSTLQAMQQSALQASRPHATLDIAKDIAEIAFAAKQKQPRPKKQEQKVLMTV